MFSYSLFTFVAKVRGSLQLQNVDFLVFKKK